MNPPNAAPGAGGDPARSELRVLVLATHYADYSVRFTEALAKRARVRLVIERNALRAEATEDVRRTARAFAALVHVRAKGRLGRILGSLHVIGIMLAFRPHVIHAQEHPVTAAAWLIKIAARLAPVALVVHDPEPHSGAAGDHARSIWAQTEMERAAAKAFVVHGAYCKALLAKAVADRPIVSIPHGPIMEPRGLPQHLPTPGRILLFGRMEAYKGLELLLQAGRLMREAGVDFTFVLAGRGPELSRLRGDFEALGAEIHEQYLAPEEAVAQFQRAAVVTAPYTDATQSGVIAAAFANGRPVAATRVGGLPDLVADEKNGLLTPPGEPAALAEALTRLIGDAALWGRLSAGAKATASGEGGWDLAADECLTLYGALLSSARGCEA